MHTVRIAAAFLLGAISVAPAAAQRSTETGPGAGGSPHYRTEWTIDGANVSISYGRPSLKGRSEAQLMPAGRAWRTGADTATRITTNRALTFGSVRLEPGTYTINTQPGETWQLLLGRMATPGQWGVPYRMDLEIGRAPMTLGRTAAPVEQLTIAIDDTPAGATLRVEWGTVRATIPFTVAQ